MQLFLDEVTSKERVLEDMNKMNAFGGGDRLTGTRGQRDYCAWLKDEIRAMGIDVVSKEYRFDRWEAQEWSLTVDGQPVAVSSPFHYSGLTGEAGVTAKLCAVCNNPLDFQRARGKIAVCHIRNLRHQQQGGVQQAPLSACGPRGGKELPRPRQHLFREDVAHVLVAASCGRQGDDLRVGGYV